MCPPRGPGHPSSYKQVSAHISNKRNKSSLMTWTGKDKPKMSLEHLPVQRRYTNVTQREGLAAPTQGPTRKSAQFQVARDTAG